MRDEFKDGIIMIVFSLIVLGSFMIGLIALIQ